MSIIYAQSISHLRYSLNNNSTEYFIPLGQSRGKIKASFQGGRDGGSQDGVGDTGFEPVTSTVFSKFLTDFGHSLGTVIIRYGVK